MGVGVPSAMFLAFISALGLSDPCSLFHSKLSGRGDDSGRSEIAWYAAILGLESS